MAKNEKPTTACFLNPNFLALLTQRRRSAALGSSPPTRPCRTPHSSPLLVAPASCPLSALLSTPARPPAGQQAADDSTTRRQTSRALAAHESRSTFSRTSSSRMSAVWRACRPQARDHEALSSMDLEHAGRCRP